jgi:hypothetical protein
MAWILVVCGVFAICGSLMNWEWFMNHRKARFMTRMLGRGGTRIFYGLLGTALVVLGLLIAFGVIEQAA